MTDTIPVTLKRRETCAMCNQSHDAEKDNANLREAVEEWRKTADNAMERYHAAWRERDALMADAARTAGEYLEMRSVLLRLAPYVAVLGRAENVSPSARAELLAVEPEMLHALTPHPAPEARIEKLLAEKRAQHECTGGLQCGICGANECEPWDHRAEKRAGEET